jgi:hypothetical protein
MESRTVGPHGNIAGYPRTPEAVRTKVLLYPDRASFVYGNIEGVLNFNISVHCFCQVVNVHCAIRKR